MEMKRPSTTAYNNIRTPETVRTHSAYEKLRFEMEAKLTAIAGLSSRSSSNVLDASAVILMTHPILGWKEYMCNIPTLVDRWGLSGW